MSSWAFEFSAVGISSKEPDVNEVDVSPSPEKPCYIATTSPLGPTDLIEASRLNWIALRELCALFLATGWGA